MSKLKNKKTLSSKIQVNGRDENKENTSPMDLNSLLGFNGNQKYGTLDREVYENQLNSFNVAELRNHAIRAGLIPISDITRLKKQLLIDFDKHVLKAKNPTKKLPPQLNGKNREEALKILSAVK